MPRSPGIGTTLRLLVNALKAAGEHGKVSALFTADTDRVAFVVSNSGDRLTSAELESRVAAESGNDPRGFGLWVCREVATQFEGGFSVEDSVEFSTKLLFWIPKWVRHEVAAVD